MKGSVDVVWLYEQYIKQALTEIYKMLPKC